MTKNELIREMEEIVAKEGVTEIQRYIETDEGYVHTYLSTYIHNYIHVRTYINTYMGRSIDRQTGSKRD